MSIHNLCFQQKYEKYQNFYLKIFLFLFFFFFYFSGDIFNIQSTLVISNSLISNYHLSRSENLAPVLSQRSTNRQQNIVAKRSNFSSFPQYFQFISYLGSQITYSLVLKVVVRLNVFLSSANLICRSTDISKCFIESLRI